MCSSDLPLVALLEERHPRYRKSADTPPQSNEHGKSGYKLSFNSEIQEKGHATFRLMFDEQNKLAEFIALNSCKIIKIGRAYPGSCMAASSSSGRAAITHRSTSCTSCRIRRDTARCVPPSGTVAARSEEHTSELQSLMRI